MKFTLTLPKIQGAFYNAMHFRSEWTAEFLDTSLEHRSPKEDKKKLIGDMRSVFSYLRTATNEANKKWQNNSIKQA